MNENYKFQSWIIENWSRAGLLAAVLLLAISPFLFESLGLIGFLVFLQLPAYLFHQYEEHAQGKFKAFVNQLIGGGKELINDAAILWVNVLVWVVDIAALYLVQYLAPAYGLIAAYLTVINGLVHILGGIALRKYNPGLWTSLFLFLPVGGYCLYVLSQLAEVTLWWHGVSIALVIVFHIVIIISQRPRLQKAE